MPTFESWRLKMPENYSAKELDEQKEKSKPIYWARSPIKKSTGYLLAGQPVAGKTKLADIFTRQHNGNIVFVSSDDY